MTGLSGHKIGRYGKQLVLNALPNSSMWNTDNFEDSKEYDIEWEGFKIAVFTSAVIKGTGFAFPNPTRFKTNLVNVFVGIDGDTNHFWVRTGLDKTIFYGSVKESITVEQLPDSIRKVAEGGESNG